MRLKVTASQVVIALVATVLTTQTQAQSPKLKMTTDIPQSITAPDKVETSIGTLEYFDGVPQPKTVEWLRGGRSRVRLHRNTSAQII